VTPQTNGWHTIYAPTGDRLLWILRGPRGRVKNAHVESGLWTVVKSRGRAIVRSYIGECSWQTGSGEILESTPVSRLRTNSSCGWLRLRDTRTAASHLVQVIPPQPSHGVCKIRRCKNKTIQSAIPARVDSPLMASGQQRTSPAASIHTRHGDGVLPTREQTNRTDRLSIFQY